MHYVDGFLAAVPLENKQKFIEHAKFCSDIIKEYGAINIIDCWEDEVPDGKLTSMPQAVQKKEGEVVIFSWITWPSKEVRDAGMKKWVEDPRMKEEESRLPFDGKRLIFGGFEMVHSS